MSNWGLFEKQQNFDMTKYYVADKNIVWNMFIKDSFCKVLLTIHMCPCGKGLY